MVFRHIFELKWVERELTRVVALYAQTTGVASRRARARRASLGAGGAGAGDSLAATQTQSYSTCQAMTHFFRQVGRLAGGREGCLHGCMDAWMGIPWQSVLLCWVRRPRLQGSRRCSHQHSVSGLAPRPICTPSSRLHPRIAPNQCIHVLHPLVAPNRCST